MLKKYIIPVAVLILIVGGILYRLFYLNEITNCYKLTVGNVVYMKQFGNNRGTHVEYSVGEKQYNALGEVYSEELNIKYITIIYPCSNPSFGQVLLTPEEFKKFNLPFPDSLKWILEYIE